MKKLLILLLCFVGVLGFFRYRWSLRKPRERKAAPMTLIGAHGVAQETFVVEGKVLVLGEVWRAESVDGILDKGAQVTVIELLPGLKLRVKKWN